MSVASSAKPAAGDKAPALILEQFMPYRIVALGQAMSGQLARAYAGQNLTIPEWRVLAVVSQADQIAARDVVRRTPMDKMTVMCARPITVTAGLPHYRFRKPGVRCSIALRRWRLPSKRILCRR